MVLLGSLLSVAVAQDVPPPLPPDPNGAVAGDPNPSAQPDPNVEVLTRGPVHEAYAVPLSAGQTTGMIVPKQPAAPIEEVPPDMKPEGSNSVWIPGYWGWDDDRRDFLWVSGVWRAPPPGYRWMPGYWQSEVARAGIPVGFRLLDACPAGRSDIPAPAAAKRRGRAHQRRSGRELLLDRGPLAMGRTRITSGSRAIGRRANRIGSGCRRLIIGAPEAGSMCPATGITPWPAAAWSFRRSTLPGRWPFTGRRFAWTWARSASRSSPARPMATITFGDYYDDRYVALGIRPWFYYGSPRYGYDPLFTYYRWYHVEHMGERQWDDHLRGWHEYYRGHPDMRPPHTLAAERALLASRRVGQGPTCSSFTWPTTSIRPGGARLQAVSAAERAQLHQAARETVRFGAERQQLERSGTGAARGQAERVSLNQMSSFKSTQLPGVSAANTAISRSAGGTAAARRGQIRHAPRRTILPAPPQPARKPSREPSPTEKEREKKPQASTVPPVTPSVTPATNAAVAAHSDRTATSNVAGAKSQPQTYTVMRADPGSAGSPPPRTAAPSNHTPSPANNNPGGRDSRNDDKRARDKESRPPPAAKNNPGGRNEEKHDRDKDAR